MANGAGDPSGFTVKEMLQSIQADIREVKSKLDSKADQSSLQSERARITALEREQDRREASYRSIDKKASQEDVDKLEEKVSSLTKALYTCSLSVVGAVLVFLVQQGGFH